MPTQQQLQRAPAAGAEGQQLEADAVQRLRAQGQQKFLLSSAAVTTVGSPPVRGPQPTLPALPWHAPMDPRAKLIARTQGVPLALASSLAFQPATC